MNKALLSILFAAALLPQGAMAQSEETTESGEAPQTEQPAHLYFKDGKLHFKSNNEKFHLWLDNRVYVDGAAYYPTKDIDDVEAKPNKDLEDADSRFRFSDGFQIRRARFGVKAEMGHWFSELDLDFAYNEVEIKDMYLGYRFNDHVWIKAGNFKEPMSMERLTSSKYLTTMERPMVVDAFAGGRRIGIAATAWGNHWWAAGGYFGQQADILQKERNRGDDGHGVTGRVALSPINNDDLTIHLGGYASWRTPDANGNDDRLVEFRTFPESRVDRRRFVRTKLHDVDHYTILGYELGLRYKKLLAYGEYIFTDVMRHIEDNGVRVKPKNATFNGWYATASYMLRGQQRRYAPEDAEFGPMTVCPKGGNLEVAARVSTINMNDFHDARAVVLGGKALAWSASLNWYPIRNVLVGINYTFINNDKYADDNGQLTVGGQPLSKARTEGIDFSVLQTRLMVSF